MQPVAFTAFAERSVGEASAKSYASYLRRIERELGVDLDAVALDEDAITGLKAKLKKKAVPMASVNNIGSALACYARFQSRAGQP